MNERANEPTDEPTLHRHGWGDTAKFMMGKGGGWETTSYHGILPRRAMNNPGYWRLLLTTRYTHMVLRPDRLQSSLPLDIPR